jgi:hypothetical protein
MSAGPHPSFYPSPAPGPPGNPIGTTQALTYYVATTGSDSNDGITSLTPLLTIQAAIDKIPKRVRHLIKVEVAAGSYAGFLVVGFTVEPANAVAAAGIVVYAASHSTATVTTGSATGTFTGTSTGDSSAPTFSTVTDSGQSWTTNNLKGKLIEVLTGDSTGTFLPIVSNTATAITLESTSATGSIGGTYAIRDWNVTITSPVTYPLFTDTASATAFQLKYGIFVRNNMTGQSAIAVEGMAVNLGATVATACFSAGYNVGNIQFNRMKAVGAATGVSVGDGSTTRLQSCVLSVNAGKTAAAVGGSVNFYNTFVSGGTGAPAFTVGAIGALTLALIDCHLEGHPIGLKFIGNCSALMEVSGLSIDMGGNSQGIIATPFSHSNYGPTVIHGTGVAISNGSTGIQLGGAGQVWIDSLKGTGLTVGLQLDRGARCQVGSASSFTTTPTEVSLDGSSTTLAAMRAATGKILVNTAGTMLFEGGGTVP